MGQATRTTILLLDLGQRTQGGANSDKRAFLEATVQVLNAARAFYVDFFLAHADKLSERVSYYSQKHLELRERAISANELLTWAECHTVATTEHPHPWPGWNFRERFPDMPAVYRRSVIKDAIGKVRAYLSHRRTWEQTDKRKGKPGLPGASNHPSLYQGTIELSTGQAEQRERFVRLNVYTGAGWRWVNYPVRSSHYFERRHSEAGWEQQSPRLVLRKKSAELHCAQTKAI
jgi:putative transposase